MAKSKKGVKKGSAQATAYHERKDLQKQEWTHDVYMYAQQETFDTVCIVLNEEFGFGPERLKRFGERVFEAFHELQELSRNDRDDKEAWYSLQKTEDALKRIWGQYYEPHEERYENGNGLRWLLEK